MAAARYTARYSFACTPEQRAYLDSLSDPADFVREAIAERVQREAFPEDADACIPDCPCGERGQ